MDSSDYIKAERLDYSLYVLSSRAIPHLSDGLKSATRRVLWMARDGKKQKSSALAGSCAAIHPHAAPEGAINTISASYGNNIPLLKGYGAFGTLLKPTAYGASRYTSVALSEFAKDVIFADRELIPMVDNYDGTIKEPQNFLPLIPLVLLNPQEGIAVGFASNILPRSLKNIIRDQISHLQGKSIPKNEAAPSFLPLSQQAIGFTQDKTGKKRWMFRGSFDKINATTVRITNLPYGLSHQKLITKLEKLEEDGRIVDLIDDSSDEYHIVIKFKKGILSKLNEDEILSLLSLEISLSENLNVINFDGKTVLSTNYHDIITKFTNWRLQFYKQRYERLRDLIEIDIQRQRDVLLAIKKNIGSIARKIKSKSELQQYLEAINIINIQYIADLPIYRFTEEERLKTEVKLKDNLATLQQYIDIINSASLQTNIYVAELQHINKKPYPA